MARLRVRVELNRGGIGVPLHKLSSVVHESQRFFEMLAADVHIEKDRGEWLGFDFDNESLNFTAEYVGPVSAEQARAFSAAFDGVTSLRRATIAQFTRIADAIGEDELIGFGLYQSDQEAEPIEWRCLSRRDALRIADEIQLLLGAAEGLDQETHFPAVIDSGAGARLFKDRRDRAPISADQSKLPELVREVESNLSKRITHLEGEVHNHSLGLRELGESSAATEESFRGLLSTVENFCGQATRQLERLSPPAQLPAAPPPAPLPVPVPVASRRSWRALVVAAAVVVAIAAAAFVFWPSAIDQSSRQATASAASAPAGESTKPVESSQPKPEAVGPVAPSQPKQATPLATHPVSVPKSTAAVATAETVKKSDSSATLSPASQPGAEVMRVDLEASELVWVMITDSDGKTLMARTLQPNETRNLTLTKNATLRTGNAGGLHLRINGKDIGPLGPVGKVRDVQLRTGAGASKTVSPDAG